MSPRSTLAALVAAGALAVAGCGGDESSAAGNGADRAFAADMVPHHESAVQMAEIAQRRGESPFVKRLAADIIRTQREEIATLRREDQALAGAGVEKGKLGVPMDMMGMGGDMGGLETAEPFDEAFLKMMVPHHEGAITMSEAQLEKGSDPELKALAKEIIAAQRREIDAMAEELRRGGA